MTVSNIGTITNIGKNQYIKIFENFKIVEK